MNTPAVSSALLALTTLVACAAPPDASTAIDTTRAALGGDDWGFGWTDSQAYGEPQQGRSLTGEAVTPVVGIAYGGVTIDGVPIRDVRIEQNRLRGTRPNGTLVQGGGWQGAIFTAQVTPTSTGRVRIEGVASPEPGLDVYRVSRLDHTQSPPAPVPFCHPDDEGRVEALAVSTTWDQATGDRVESATHFTFACRSGVISKCVGWGYAPWPEHERGAILIKAHQACTRAARADYCAIGVSNTRNGTEINLFDRLAPQIRSDRSKTLEFEGAWNDDGVHCLTHNRWAGMPPECPRLNPARPLVGPFVRDADGNAIAPRVCDTPEEAAALAPSALIFTESLTNSLLPVK